MAITPMMQQYLAIKEQYKDAILFYRLGDFYEMFFDDAELVSRELELTLTGKDCGLSERAPMCGVPFHSADVYVARLIEKGYKVAICEQMEDPALAKGLVERAVIRVVTPGTVIESNMLDEHKSSYILSLYLVKDKAGIAFSDVSTGEFYAYQFSGARGRLSDELSRIAPREILCNDPALAMTLAPAIPVKVTAYDGEAFDFSRAGDQLLQHFQVKGLEELGLDNVQQAYYATKVALWCYLVPGWSIDKVTIAPGLSEHEQQIAERILAATKDIYNRGSGWTDTLIPGLTVTADQDQAYEVQIDGLPVSSTRVRAAIAAGEMEEAARLLGRPYALCGVIQRGKQLGRKLDFPTANLLWPEGKAIPPKGVYAARVYVDEAWYIAAVNVGTHPTAPGGPPTIEANLLDYEGGSLYGHHMRLLLCSFVRSEKKFDSLEALRDEVMKNREQVRTYFENRR